MKKKARSVKLLLSKEGQMVKYKFNGYKGTIGKVLIKGKGQETLFEKKKVKKDKKGKKEKCNDISETYKKGQTGKK